MVSPEVYTDGGNEALYARITELEKNCQDLEQKIQVLEQNDVFCQRILATSPQIIYVYDLELQGNVFSNRQMQDALGYSSQQVIEMGAHFLDLLLHPEDLVRLPDILARWETASDTDILTLEYRMKHADGNWRWFLATDSVFQRNQKGVATQVIGSALDITERKLMEAERERLRSAIEQTEDMIVITEPEGTIQYVNSAFEQISGYRREDVIGKNTRLLKSDRVDPELYKTLWQTLRSGEPWEGQFVNKRKDGTFYTEKASISPVRNAQGEVTNFVAVKQDITQIQVLEQQVLQASKMESIGRLAGGVAHDFNNMLTVILGHVELILEYSEGPEHLIQDLEEVKQAAKSSADLTQQLLAFARKQPVIPRKLDLNQCISDTINLLKRLIGEEIDLLWTPKADLWSIKMDPGQLHQILTNLVVNARDALDGTGRITIRTSNISFDQSDIKQDPKLSPGDYVLLEVGDNGLGMNQDTLEHLFEPFFTTKKMKNGTGLGLATIYGIVQQNNGFIKAESEVQKGSQFQIFLPKNPYLIKI